MRVKTEKRKAVIYCRVACADQLTMDNQEKITQDFADKEGYIVDKCYRDNGESGATLNRPGMNKLLYDIRNGEVKTIIAKDFARFSRSLPLLREFTNVTKKHGVILETINDRDFEI